MDAVLPFPQKTGIPWMRRGRKKRSILKTRPVYILGRILLLPTTLFLSLLPYRLRNGIVGVLGLLFYFVNSPDRRLSLFNLRLVFGEQLQKMRPRRIIRNSFTKLVTYLADAYFAPVSPSRLLKNISVEPDLRKIEKELSLGRGAVVLTAHFGNEGLLCYVVATLTRSYCLGRYQRIFQSVMDRNREKHNVITVIDKKTSYDELLSVLRDGRILLATLDRSLRRKGVFVDFLGLPAHTPYFASDLSRLAGAPIFVAFLFKIDGRYRFFCEGPLYVPAESDEFTARRDITQKIVEIIGSYIRRFPDEWFWAHRRWRTELGTDRYPEYTKKRYPSLRDPYAFYDRRGKNSV